MTNETKPKKEMCIIIKSRQKETIKARPEHKLFYGSISGIYCLNCGKYLRKN